MIVKCKKSHRFLCEVYIEDYLKNLEKLGISQELPLTIVIPCRTCKKTEQYDIYLTHYKFVKNISKK